MTKEMAIREFRNYVKYPHLTEKQIDSVIRTILYGASMGDEMFSEIMALESLNLISPAERHALVGIIKKQVREIEEATEMEDGRRK